MSASDPVAGRRSLSRFPVGHSFIVLWLRLAKVISAAAFKPYWTAKPRSRGRLKPRVVILSSGYHQTVRHTEKGTVSEEALDARPR